MPRVTRRKHILKEMMEDICELPRGNQQIVRLVYSPGSNLHMVETAKMDNFLVRMPIKFRKIMWIKRGDYMLVEPIEYGRKVKAKICKILTPEHITEFIKANVWPERFATGSNQYIKNDVKNNKYVYTDDDDLEPNMNRPVPATNHGDAY